MKVCKQFFDVFILNTQKPLFSHRLRVFMVHVDDRRSELAVFRLVKHRNRLMLSANSHLKYNDYEQNYWLVRRRRRWRQAFDKLAHCSHFQVHAVSIVKRRSINRPSHAHAFAVL